MSGSVVVDASLAVKWLVEEDDSDKAHAALQSWVAQDITRIAPHLMPFEVANALHRRVLRGELNVGDSIRMIARLLASRLELHQPPGLHVRALQLASQLKQNAAYDAHYLALARGRPEVFNTGQGNQFSSREVHPGPSGPSREDQHGQEGPVPR